MRKAAISDPEITPERRRLMARVRQRDTKPELAVRRAAHAMGYRFRLHRRDLPGRPDLVFPRWRVAVFVHGCFWHLHQGCPKATVPKARRDWWLDKLQGNRARDARAESALRALGWQVAVIWECETRSDVDLRRKLGAILSTMLDCEGKRPDDGDSRGTESEQA